MFFQIKSYLKFLWKSTNEHGVHSPFVFDLATKCLYDKKIDPEYKSLENYRKSLLRNHVEITVTDFGAGSKVFKSNKRKVSAIARNAGVSSHRARLLFRIAKYFSPENVLEIGTSVGMATIALATGNKDSKVTTLEGCRETAKIAESEFRKNYVSNVNVITGEFETVIPQLNSQYQLIYFDGNHTKEATLRYFEMLLPTVTNETLWIFDDIHWSPEMESAWETIKQNPKVTVTIDTFQWGLIFFRKEQEKENFTIRA